MFLYFLGLLIVVILGGTLFLVSRLDTFGSNPSPEEMKAFEKSAQFNVEKQMFDNKIPNLLEVSRKRFMKPAKIFEFLKGYIIPGYIKDLKPKERMPAEKFTLENLQNELGLHFAWFGHSSIFIRTAGLNFLIDPVLSDSVGPFGFTMPRYQEAPVSLSELPSIDFILISHDHYDHLDMETIEFFKDKETIFFVPLGVAAHLRYWGIESSRIQEFDWWEEIKFKGIQLTSAPAQHFSGRVFFEQRKSLWTSWIIKVNNHKIFFSGDSGYATHFKTIGEKHGPFDLVFMESGQYNIDWPEVHLTPEESVQALLDVKGDKLFGIHWGMFTLSTHTWYEPRDRLFKASQERGVVLINSKLGEVVSLD